MGSLSRRCFPRIRCVQVATLDPTLSNKLIIAPFHYSANKVGLLFTVSSVLYIISSVPVGWSAFVGFLP